MGVWGRIFNCQLNSLEKVREVIHKKVGHSLKRKMGRHGDGGIGRRKQPTKSSHTNKRHQGQACKLHLALLEDGDVIHKKVGHSTYTHSAKRTGRRAGHKDQSVKPKLKALLRSFYPVSGIKMN